MELKIKELCELKGISISELGRKLGMPKSSIHTIINNGNPTIETLEKIAIALGVEIPELLKKKPEEEGIMRCPKCGTKYKEIN